MYHSLTQTNYDLMRFVYNTTNDFMLCVLIENMLTYKYLLMISSMVFIIAYTIVITIVKSIDKIEL